MGSEPGVERKAVVARPPGVPLERDQRVAVLQGRPDGGDQRRKALAAGEVAHALDQHPGEPLAAAASAHHRDHGREHVRLRPRAVAEPGLEDVVDAARQPFGLACRHRARVADDEVLFLVPEDELEVRQLLAELPPVPDGDLAVAHELREGVLHLARPRREVRALRVREQAHDGHPSEVSSRRGASAGRRGSGRARTRRRSPHGEGLRQSAARRARGGMDTRRE